MSFRGTHMRFFEDTHTKKVEGKTSQMVGETRLFEYVDLFTYVSLNYFQPGIKTSNE